MFGFISQPGRSHKTSWFHIGHIGHFYPFSPLFPSLNGISLGALDDSWEKNSKQNVLFQNSLESGRSVTSESDSPLLDVLFSTLGLYYNYMSFLLLFYGVTIGSWLGVSLGYSSISGVNQVSLRSIFSSALLCELRFTIYVQYGVVMTSLMNGTVKIHHQTPHEIEVRREQLVGLEP